MGDRLKQFREKAGLTQAELADRAGVKVASLQAWEQDRSDMLLGNAKSLASALSATLDELFGPAAVAPKEKPPKKRGRPRKPDQE